MKWTDVREHPDFQVLRCERDAWRRRALLADRLAEELGEIVESGLLDASPVRLAATLVSLDEWAVCDKGALT